MNYYLSVLRNFSFQGRARRAEFWWTFLISLIVVIVLAVVSDVLHLTVPIGDQSVPTYGYYQQTLLRIPVLIYGLATIIQGLALSVRRLHDRNMSGWFILIGVIPLLGGLILLIMYALPGTQGPNKFGPDPKGG